MWYITVHKLNRHTYCLHIPQRFVYNEAMYQPQWSGCLLERVMDVGLRNEREKCKEPRMVCWQHINNLEALTNFKTFFNESQKKIYFRKDIEGHIKKNQNATGLQLQHKNAENNKAMTSKFFKPIILYPAKLLKNS